MQELCKMGFKTIQLKLSPGYSDGELKNAIRKISGLKDFTFRIETKSLDARKKNNIHWLLNLVVLSNEIPGKETEDPDFFEISFRRRNKKILIAGSGPAGFFAAYVLQRAGFETLLVEQGSEVEKRAAGIVHFERSGEFNPSANYSFGEGGAGTFSDGKLTSRSKHISSEKRFIISSYIEAGAPGEIRYMAYPHLGSDNLKKIVKKLRSNFQEYGGEIRFDTKLTDLEISNDKVNGVMLGNDLSAADYFIIAPGHSSYETYRMLIRCGVKFRTKNFAIGTRAEHLQEEINHAQWGVDKIPGVNAAEYRLTSEGDGRQPVYTFCMCPGGMVVPAAPYSHINIVNGMSNFRRNGRFANAACVAGVHPDQLAGKKVTAAEALNWLENLENSFYVFSNGYQAPFCSINNFLQKKHPKKIPQSSYPLGIKPAPLWELLPPVITNALMEGIPAFIRKMKAYENGILLGLESKTSSPVQAIREKNGLCEGFRNLFIAGEGSGYSGGIISSAADGIKIARAIMDREG
jgi:uncharacterized protein